MVAKILQFKKSPADARAEKFLSAVLSQTRVKPKVKRGKKLAKPS